MTTYRLLAGDVRETLATLPDASVQCVVTSPPYWGLRDYGTATWEGGDSECDHTRPSRVNTEAAVKTSTLVGSKDSQGHLQEPSYRNVCGKCGAMRIDAQLGLEPTPDAYVANLVQVFREVRRVLKDDGTLWLNLGDSYASGGTGGCSDRSTLHGGRGVGDGEKLRMMAQSPRPVPHGLKPKDLVGIPWMVAFALRADGWYLRSDIIWSKPNPMPESVTDRPTKAHEYIFLLTKSPGYYYDAAAIAEPAIHAGESRVTTAKSFAGQATGAGVKPTGNARPGPIVNIGETRNRRSVWTVATQPYAEAHFATFPEALIEPCILAGSREGDTVLDPFNGSGTTGAVSVRHQRNYIGCELNPEYIALARERIGAVAPLFAIEQDARAESRMRHERAAALASPPAADENALRAAWEAGFRLCRRYGDNHHHWDGEQRERRWREYLARAAQAPPASDPPGLVEVVAEFQRAHADYQRAKHEDVGQEFAWSARKSARDAVLAYHLPASPQAETKRDCTCLGACRGDEGLSPRYRCVLAPPQAETTKGGR